MKYEYKHISTDETVLNEHGSDGWRLVMERNLEGGTLWLLERPYKTRTVQSKMNKSIQERKVDFIKAIEPYKHDYHHTVVSKFIEYWTEHGEKDKKMRFEKQNTFSFAARLKRFDDNNKNWSNGSKPMVENDL
jgi:hypothetical protein